MTLFAEIQQFLQSPSQGFDGPKAVELLEKSYRTLVGYNFLAGQLQDVIVDAPHKINMLAAGERALADQLYEALSHMCSTRGILPNDIELVCGALEAYDAARNTNKPTTGSDLEF